MMGGRMRRFQVKISEVWQFLVIDWAFGLKVSHATMFDFVTFDRRFWSSPVGYAHIWSLGAVTGVLSWGVYDGI